VKGDTHAEREKKVKERWEFADSCVWLFDDASDDGENNGDDEQKKTDTTTTNNGMRSSAVVRCHTSAPFPRRDQLTNSTPNHIQRFP
jgi:hypothetical protein